MTAKYQWKLGGPKPKVAASVFGAIVEKLAGGSGIDAVKPQAIVDQARSKTSAIHKLFNWKDKDAADLWRRKQARQYIETLQIVRVEVTEGPALSNRAFFSVRVGTQRAYASHDRVLSDRDLKSQVIADAKRDLEHYLNRYTSALAFGTYIPRLQSVLDDMRSEVDQLALDAARRPRPEPPAAANSRMPLATAAE